MHYRWNMRPRAAQSGQEALNWLRHEKFDSAILDMQMPEMDGLTLADQIQQQSCNHPLPLIMMASLAKQEIGKEAVESRFTVFLNKPIKQVQLHHVLTQVLSNHCNPFDRSKSDLSRSTQSIPHLAQALPLRILLAEDHAVNQKMALLLLQCLGYRADLASNGLEVLAALRRQSYDVVLMDVQMPEMDGLIATRCINQTWTDTRPRIIGVTANAMQGDREQCLAAGMDDYISKPIRSEELVAALSRCQPLSSAKVNRCIQESQDFTCLDDSLNDSMNNPIDNLDNISGNRFNHPENIPDENSVLDPSALQQLRLIAGEGASEFIVEAIECYLEEAPKLLQAVRTSAAAHDITALQRSAHTLKASSATIGATVLTQLCQTLEHMPKEQALAATDHFLQLESEYIRVQAALQQICQENR